MTGSDTLDKRLAQLPCQRDDRFNFLPTGVLVRSEGSLSCSGSQPRATVNISSWSLDASGTKLTIKSGTVTTIYTIKQLTTDALQLGFSSVVEGVPVTEVLSYLN